MSFTGQSARMIFVGLACAVWHAQAIEVEGGVIFSESFSGANPVANSSLSGTQFTVTSGLVDVVGNLNGSFFSFNGEANNNGLDLVGSPSAGSIQSIPKFNLIAGNQYKLSWRSVASGPLDTDPVFDNLASIGSFWMNFSDDQRNISNGHYVVTHHLLTFIPTLTELNVQISFKSLETHGGGFNGSLIDDIVLSESPAAVPEPSSICMFLGVSVAMAFRLRNKTRALSD